MAFEIGERITNKFTGPGRIVGELVRNDGEVTQKVQFDNPTLGIRDWPVQKMEPAEDGGDISV
jgi:hypothetical protein